MRSGLQSITVRLSMIALVMVAGTLSAQPTRTIRGSVIDSVGGTPVSGAVIEVRSAAIQRVARSDETGSFRLTKLPPGTFRMVVRRIGYAETVGEMRVEEKDLDIVVRLRSIGANLDTVRVQAGMGIYGIVGTSPDLLPVVGANVVVLGANERTLTDSSGRYFVPLRTADDYVVRISRAGYVPLVQTIKVPKDRAVEASVILDSAQREAPKGAEGFWKDFDQRLRWRRMNSALISATELHPNAPATLTTAMILSPAFSKRGLRLGGGVCVFVNGIPKPGLPLDAIDPYEVAVMEVYGAKGDETGTLAKRWPSNAPCGLQNSLASGRNTGSEVVKIVSVWLKP